MAVDSVAHREEIPLSSPDAKVQARSEQNPSVSVMAVTDDQQAQQSMLGVFANARNVLITGGTFVSLCCSYVCDFHTYFMNRMFSLLMLSR